MKILTKTTTIFLAALIAGLFLSPLLSSITGNEVVSFTNIALAEEHESYRFLAPIGGLGEEIDVSSKDSFPEYINTMITVVIGFAIMAAIILIIASGFQYMTSTSQSGVSKAKEQITNAILGLVLALSAVVILQTINPNLVELNSVETVTTSGDSLVMSEGGWESWEYGGESFRDDGTYKHAGKYCMHIDSTWSVAFFFGFDSNSDYDRFICFDSLEECNEGAEAARDADENSAEWFSGVECAYYHKSTGELKEIDSGDKMSDLVGASSEGPAEARRVCEESATQVVTDKSIDECRSALNPQYDKSLCEASCGEADEEPFQIPDNWVEESVEWCSVNDAVNSDCKNSREACNESFTEGCYAHPDGMNKKGGGIATDCTNCTWLDGESYNVREPSPCSPENEGGEYCRVSPELSTELSRLHNNLQNTTIGYEVTESFPPREKYSDDCYYNGSCVSIQLQKPLTGESFTNDDYGDNDNEGAHLDRVLRFIERAENLGLQVEYRVGENALRNYLRGNGVSDDHIHQLATHGDPHFVVKRD